MSGSRRREAVHAHPQARNRLPLVTYTDRDLYAIAALTADFKVDGHRADIVILKAARAHAAFEGRLPITDRDILLAAELALPHRLKRQPFQEAGLEQSQLEDRLRKAQEQAQAEIARRPQSADGGPLKKSPEGSESVNNDSQPGTPSSDSAPQSRQSRRAKRARTSRQRGRRFPVQATGYAAGPIDAQPGRPAQRHPHRPQARPLHQQPAAGESRTTSPSTPPCATAAIHQRQRYEEAEEHGEETMALELRKQDLQRKVRVRRANNLILFVVDASWSMAAAERMEATKGAIMSLLMDAYQRRDQVGLVVFQKDRARLVLPPTSSVDLASARSGISLWAARRR